MATAGSPKLVVEAAETGWAKGMGESLAGRWDENRVAPPRCVRGRAVLSVFASGLSAVLTGLGDRRFQSAVSRPFHHQPVLEGRENQIVVAAESLADPPLLDSLQSLEVLELLSHGVL